MLPGDASGDGRVDVGDLGILAANYGRSIGVTWELGDFNGDGAVDVGDLGILAANYGKGVGMSAEDGAKLKVSGTVFQEGEQVESKKENLKGTGCPLMSLSLLTGMSLSLVLIGGLRKK